MHNEYVSPKIIGMSQGHIHKYENQDVFLFYCQLIALFSILRWLITILFTVPSEV